MGTAFSVSHDQQVEVLAQGVAHLEAQRQPQIRHQSAFMELVEDHGGDPVKLRIVLQAAGQDALGNHLDPGLG